MANISIKPMKGIIPGHEHLFVVNPRTGRNIKVGGKTWKMLVSNGILESKGLERNEYADISDPNKRMPLYEADTEQHAEIAKQMIKEDPEIAKKVGITKGTHIKKIGKKLIKVSQKTSPTDMAEYTAKCASKMLNREMETLVDDYEKRIYSDSEDFLEDIDTDELDSLNQMNQKEIEDFEEKLKRLILEEMIKSSQKNKTDIDNNNNRYSGTDFELEPVDVEDYSTE